MLSDCIVMRDGTFTHELTVSNIYARPTERQQGQGRGDDQKPAMAYFGAAR